MTVLSECLSGVFTGISGVNRNFIKYDTDLAELLSEMSDIDEDPQDARMTFSKRWIDTLTGSTQYTLSDGIYQIELGADTTFILPTPEDLTIFHEIVITAKYTNQYDVTFKDGNNTTLSTLTSNDWDVNDVVEYLCRYENFLNKWCIMSMKMN